MSSPVGPTGLLGADKFRVPRAEALRTVEHLRDRGRHGVEGVVLWAGVLQDGAFNVRRAVVPEQTAHRSPSGLMYVVEGDELLRVNQALYRDGLVLGAQVHSHPSDAYHSDLDDAHAIVTVVGGLSVVVPDFGRGPIRPAAWAVYRLASDGRWVDVGAPGPLVLI